MRRADTATTLPNVESQLNPDEEPMLVPMSAKLAIEVHPDFPGLEDGEEMDDEEEDCGLTDEDVPPGQRTPAPTPKLSVEEKRRQTNLRAKLRRLGRSENLTSYPGIEKMFHGTPAERRKLTKEWMESDGERREPGRP